MPKRHTADERERAVRMVREQMGEFGGGTPSGIQELQVTRAAQEGDGAAIECFTIVGEWLDVGMSDLASILDPEVFVLAGV